ncbi:MAG: phytoene desaturase family protein [Alphaproteobacteria bacterium]
MSESFAPIGSQIGGFAPGTHPDYRSDGVIPAETDVIIIGGGINGLTAAAYCAKARLSTLVLEARHLVGGMASNGDIEPGFSLPVCAHVISRLDPRVVRDLGLYKRGLTYAVRRLETTALDEDGAHLTLPADPVRARAVLAQVAPQDGEEFGTFMARMNRLAAAFAASSLGGREKGLDAARTLKRLPAGEARALAMATHGRVTDVLDQAFDHPLIRGALAFDAGLGATQPPSAPGTLLPWLHRLSGECAGMRGTLGLAKGGMGSVAGALHAAATEAGARVQFDTAVRSLLVEGDRVAGVVLASGARVRSRYVLSSLDPQSTCLGLLGTRHMDVELVRRLKRWRSKGVTGKVNLSLDGLPRFRGLAPERLAGRLVVAPSTDYLESAYRPIKYGEMSTYPALEVIIPSLSDPDMAPAGRHVMSVVVQYVPYLASPEANEALRRQLAKAVIDRLSFHAPDLPDLVRKVAVLTPRDMEAAFGARGGHWHQGDLAADQLGPNRRIDGLLVDGLRLCGAATGPGGGVSGEAGRDAARAIIAEDKGR